MVFNFVKVVFGGWLKQLLHIFVIACDTQNAFISFKKLFENLPTC